MVNKEKKNKVTYQQAGVNIDAGNETVKRIKKEVNSTFTKDVMTGIGSFSSLYDLRSVMSTYENPVMVQSIDGVGTKTIIARKLNKYDTIGIDLLSACVNDILVMGARPLTFLDYIANDKLEPNIIEQIVAGMAKACRDIGVSLVGGETAEMPDTYLPGEHDLVGVITGIVEKEKVITGEKICPGDYILGLASSGLHTNGYSLARKVFFDIGELQTDDKPKELDKPIGHALLEPHINYTKHVSSLINNDINVKGIAHITGGGLLENIPRILPNECMANIEIGSWPILGLFQSLQRIGEIEDSEMFRTFNMGIGMIFIINQEEVGAAFDILSDLSDVYHIGRISKGQRMVNIGA